MDITMLGGGNEVGASCMHVLINNVRVLVDAGTRMNNHDNLPTLGRLEELGGIDLVLVTHAHADHIGALPYLKRMYPSVPMYATKATIDLMHIMMLDSYRILEETSLKEKKLLPYSREDVEDCLDGMREFPEDEYLVFENIEIFSYTAGHILGAVMYGIQSTTKEERVLVTGDFSAHPSRALAAMHVPHDFQPNVVVMESTYGNKVHTDRLYEEQQFAQEVASVLNTGGKVLIPSFALGRAQDIVLILKHYMRTRVIPTFPIYVDGLVKDICEVYNTHKGSLHDSLKNSRFDDIFFGDGNCHKINSEHERQRVLSGGPCCIVSSSGMLNGGPSVRYARDIVQRETDAIFVIGYQDDESPGRRLLSLVHGGERKLSLENTNYDVKCRVKGFGLSAHADSMAMRSLVRTLSPKHVVLVHGDKHSQESLRRNLRTNTTCSINNETYNFPPDWTRTEQPKFHGRKVSLMNKVVVYKRFSRHKISLDPYNTDPRDFVVALCTKHDPRNSNLVCEPLLYKEQVTIQEKDVWYTLGAWSGSREDLYQQYRHFLQNHRQNLLNWTTAGEGRKETVNTIASKMGKTDIMYKILISDYLSLLPDTNKYNTEEQTFFRMDIDAVRILNSYDINGVQREIERRATQTRSLLECVETWSTDYSVPICGCTISNNVIQLSFISPQIALFYQDELSVLTKKTALNIHILSRYTSHKIWDLVKMVIPEEKIQSFRIDQKEDRIILTRLPGMHLDPMQTELYESMVYDLTGLKLVVE